jgi:hypothetical protein
MTKRPDNPGVYAAAKGGVCVLASRYSLVGTLYHEGPVNATLIFDEF